MVSEPPDILARLREMRLRYKPTHRTLGRETSTSRSWDMICTISMEKDDDVSSSQHPSPIRHILCGICLSGSHHILYRWMDIILHQPADSVCLHVFQTTRHILFRGNEDGAHDNTYFSDREFVLSPILPLGSRPPGSVAQCPGDTSLDNYSICQRPQDTRGPHTAHTAPSHGSTTPQW